MPESQMTVFVNGKSVYVPEGTMVSSVLLTARTPSRLSISGEPRTALCGMGICFECRAIVNGVPHARTCQIACREGMQVDTQP
ncbi:MAG TPA: (2Fe-2S)-binding protein [Acidobacteriaceae bacterium]